jgi:hypothetical protein
VRIYQHCEIREVDAKGCSGFFPCNFIDCTCWFTSVSALRQHMKRDHQKELVII